MLPTHAGALMPHLPAAGGIGWLESVFDPDGVAAHANAGTADLGFINDGRLHAGLVGYAGETIVWSIASWVPTAGGPSPTLTDLGGGKAYVQWGNLFSDQAWGQLILTATVNGVPIASGQRLVATVVEDNDFNGYSELAWGPE